MKTKRKDVQEAYKALEKLLGNGSLFSVTNGWPDMIEVEFENEPGGDEDGYFFADFEVGDGKGSASIKLDVVIRKLLQKLEEVDFVEIKNV